MKRGTLISLLAVTALTVADAQRAGSILNFPFSNCGAPSSSTSPYRLSPIVKAYGSGKYCFTLHIAPVPHCTSYCCKSADVTKLEVNVRKECYVAGTTFMKATINGVSTSVGAAFEFPAQSPVGSAVLRLTQLGLGLGSDGAEFCIHLMTTADSRQGCTTLDDLCEPLPGQPAGVCHVALFDTHSSCCSISRVRVPRDSRPGVARLLQSSSSPTSSLNSPSTSPSSPTPSPSLPPSPPASPPSLPSLPPPLPLPPSLSPEPPARASPLPTSPRPLLAGTLSPSSPSIPTLPPPASSQPPSDVSLASEVRQCAACTYLTITSNNPLYPINITSDQCFNFADVVIADIAMEAAAVGAYLLETPSRIECSENQIKICSFFENHTEGAKLQPWIETRASFWLSIVVGSNNCPAYLYGYEVAVTTGGDGEWPNLPPSCLSANQSFVCRPPNIPYPKAACTSRQRATPFAALPVLFTAPGRRNTTTLYCFVTDVITPYAPNSSCGVSTVLNSVEIWANETQRRRVVALGVQPFNSSTLNFRAVSWGPSGDDTVKVSPLNWNLTQAKGGKICMELDDSTTLESFCNGGTDTCWINLFSRKCCPLYAASLIT